LTGFVNLSLYERELARARSQGAERMLEAIRTHVANKLAQAELELSPFPHLIVERFFPDEVFEKILEFNLFRQNEGREWLSKEASVSVTSRTPYHARKQIDLYVREPIRGSLEHAQFWSTLSRCFLGDDWFPRLVYQTFPTYFRLRFGDLVDDPDFFSLFRRELFLQRHEPGYYIGPHTDIPIRIFTAIFSFADQAGYEEFGTELLAPDDRLARCWGLDHYKPTGFRVSKIAPYAPNNFLLFFKTRQSFHSVRAITEDVPNQRYGMQFQFYEPTGGLFHDLSAPELMSVSRR
jgi:hypothetical protein